MKDTGMSYKLIAKYLNNNNILTHTGKRWGVSGNSVYSVLKNFKKRKKRLKIKDKEYKMVWSRMKIKYEIN